MHSTSASLLDRLKLPDAKEAWDRFAELYTPLLYYWARGQGLTEPDAADLVQEVFLLLVAKLPHFQYDGEGSFRGWLRTVTFNKYRELQRRRKPSLADLDLNQIPTKEADAGLEESTYRLHLVRQMLRILKAQFPPSTWSLFEDYVLAGKEPQIIAREQGVTLGTVYAAKSKVIIRLRQELAGLLD